MTQNDCEICARPDRFSSRDYQKGGMKPFGATAIRRSKDCYTSLGKGAFGLGVRPELRETRVFTREGREKKRGKNAEILCNTDKAGGTEVLVANYPGPREPWTPRTVPRKRRAA